MAELEISSVEAGYRRNKGERFRPSKNCEKSEIDSNQIIKYEWVG